jgi:hypothetical protein
MKTIKTLKTTLSALAVAAGLFASAGAQATITTYSSATAFDAAITSETTTSWVGGGSSVPLTSPVPFAGGNFSGSSNFYLFVANQITAMPKGFLGNNAGGSLLSINFSNPVYGFALNYGLINNWSGTSNPNFLSFTIGGTTFSETLPYLGQPGQIYASYVGFTSDTAFSSVSISDPSQSFATTSIAVASGLTISSSTISPVPEPGSIALLMLGGLAVVRNAKRRNF